MRSWLCALSGFVILVGLPGLARAETDLSSMQPSGIQALQKRLSDAGCYEGPVDGQASGATAAAVEACPDQRPVLRIETGMHTAPVNRIGVDAACRLMITGSDDKTVRVWSMPDGRLQQVIRLPIGAGNGGKLRAVALSSDGRFAAAGGWDATWDKGQGIGLYLVDLSSLEVRRIGAFENVINHVAFSANGSRVAVALWDQGIRVLETATGRELMADRDYGAPSYNVTFAADGSLYATSFDGFLRRYDAELKLVAKTKAPDGRRPYALALDPAGERLAVGYDDAPAVSILKASTLTTIAKAETGDIKQGGLSAVAWTRDGQQVMAGGMTQKQFGGVWRRFVRRFDADGRRLGDSPVAESTVIDMQTCGRGIAFGAGDPSFGLTGPDDRSRTLQGPTTSDMRDKVGDAFSISADGASVRFGLADAGARPVLFSLAAGTVVDSPRLPSGLMPAGVGALRITDWKTRGDPKLDGKPITLDQYERSLALAVRPDRAGFALGADWSLRAFDAAGEKLWSKPVPGAAWGVDLAANGAIVASTNVDGTVRWYRWSDGQELLALFVNRNTRAWVAWTPTGYYMASPGAEDMIGWQINRGWTQEADFFPASRFRDKFNRPDVVRLVLKTLDEDAALMQANEAAHKHDDTQPLIERLPPVITILSPSEGSTVASGTVEVRYSLRMPSGGKVERVEAFVDGAKIEARGLGPSADGPSPALSGNGTILRLPMPAHDAEISLVAYAAGRASDAARVGLKVAAGAPDDAQMLKPSLYALLIGVTHYENKTFDLAYPAQDALGFADALKSQEGKLYQHVEIKVLTDKDATATAVKEGLLWLQRQTTARDLALVFAAGHGTTDAKGRFWFLTEDADPSRLLTTAVSRDDIADVLYDLPGKKLLFLDACHSGAALSVGTRGVEQTDLTAAVNDFAQTEGGVVAYAASTGKEFSFENAQWGHGAFTKALIEGFDGQADLLHKGTITTGMLDVFLENRVKELTDGRQHPVMNRPKTVPDFPIASVQR